MQILDTRGYLSFLEGFAGRAFVKRQMTARKLVNMGLNFGFAILRFPTVTKLPSIIQIDINNICNLKCPACPTGIGEHPKPRGQMAIDSFRRIIDEVKDYVFLIILYNSGEPFLNNDVYGMIEYATCNRIAVVTSSNGHFFEKKENVEALVRSGLDTLTITISGTTQQIYERYHVKGDCNRVLLGIRNIVKKKRELKSRTPLIIMRYLGFDYNAFEIEKVKKLARELGVDYCDIRRAVTTGEFEKVRLIKSLEKETIERPNITNHCYWLWSIMVIHWEGSVAPCCFLNRAPPEQGNVFQEGGIAEIWSGERFRNFRKRMLTDKSKIPSCKSCQSLPGIQGYFSNKARKKIIT